MPFGPFEIHVGPLKLAKRGPTDPSALSQKVNIVVAFLLLLDIFLVCNLQANYLAGNSMETPGPVGGKITSQVYYLQPVQRDQDGDQEYLPRDLMLLDVIQ